MTTSKTPNPPAVSIDLGSARTKLGYYTDSGEFELARSGGGERYMPTTVAVVDRSTILVGEAAEDAIEEMETQGRFLKVVAHVKRNFGEIRDIVVNSLKKVFKREDPWVRIGAALLKKMRELASDQPAFGGQPPDVVYLTHSPLYKDKHRNMLKAAAREAGFKDVYLVAEPVAAGRAFLQAEAKRNVLLVDCGGWTLDIAHLVRPTSSRNYREASKSKTFEVGGEIVDESLIAQVRKASGLKLTAIRPLTKVSLQVRRYKEAFCDGGPREYSVEIPPQDGPRAEKVQVVLKETDFEYAIQQYITNVCSKVVEYLNPKKQLRDNLKKPGTELSLVLVGGSSQVPGLQEALVSRLNDMFGISPHLFPTSKFYAQYAVVMGALPVPSGATRPEAKPEHGSWGTSEDTTRPTNEPSGCILGLLAALWLWFRNV